MELHALRKTAGLWWTKVFAITSGSLAGKSSNVFRLFSGDIGLLTSAYPAETKMELINKNGKVNNGAYFENTGLLFGKSICFFGWKCRKNRFCYVSAGLYVLSFKGEAAGADDC